MATVVETMGPGATGSEPTRLQYFKEKEKRKNGKRKDTLATNCAYPCKPHHLCLPQSIHMSWADKLSKKYAHSYNKI